MINLRLLDNILRAPGDVAAQCREDHDVNVVARTALATLLVSAVAFGAAVGAWRGGHQIAFAALKMPIGIIGTLALAAPAFYALAAVFGRAWPLRSVLSLVLAAGARFSLALLALTPPLWLTINFGAPYEVIKLAAALVYALAGLAGLEVLVRGLGDGPGKHMTITLFTGVFLLIGAQNAWVLRPYLGTPNQAETKLFVPLTDHEGGLAVQLYKTLHTLTDGR